MKLDVKGLGSSLWAQVLSADLRMRVKSKMADQVVKFISTTELNAKKDVKRKAREQILNKVRLFQVICFMAMLLLNRYFLQAKADFEREERRREKRKETGEDTWMLPSLSDRIGDDKEQHKVLTSPRTI